MGCNRNRLAGSLTAGPLDKKKDEETLFNKAAGALPGYDLPTGIAKDVRKRKRESREVWRCEVAKERESLHR